MLGRRNKRARADSGEILEFVSPLQRAKPTPPQQYVVFQPTPPLPKAQTQSQESPTAPGVKPGIDEKTRRAKLTEQYGAKTESIIACLLSQHADARIGTPCPCGGSKRIVRCRDCCQRPPLCVECFIREHKYIPFHWAERWNEDEQYFSTCDMSTLDPEWTLNLGHSAEKCPKATKPLHINIIETNGPHGTLVCFCQCRGRPDKLKQLFDARLFPGSVSDPGTAYTFRLLREYEVHSVASKKNAQDYTRALAQLADRQFPENTPTFYAQFRFVARLWSYLKTNIWLGQGHGIDAFLPQRPKGNLRVYCPACPEKDFNLENGWEQAPAELAHVHGFRKTLDGNHQLSHFEKNHDKSDVSWYGGNAYFPNESTQEEYLRTVPQTQKDRHKKLKPGQSKEAMDAIKEKLDKQVCGYLNVLEGQDRKKFRGMDVSGVVALLCDHVFAWAFVDMQYGERFSNCDLALGEGLKQRSFDRGKVPSQTLSYDCQCKYCRHLIERMLEAFPKLAHLLQDFRFTIPAVHVRNHLDVCMWLFSAAYKACTGRFHGETAEQIWAEFNLLGTATRQMSMGHRHDVIIQNLTGWNLRKFVQIAPQLQKDCIDAIKNYYESRDNLVALYGIHKENLKEWLTMDRSPRPNAKGSTRLSVLSVYNHNTTGVLTYQQVMDRLVQSQERISCGNWWVAESDVAQWLREALLVEDAEADLKRKEKGWTSFGRVLDEKMRIDMDSDARKLEARRVRLYDHQCLLFPMMSDYLLKVGDSEATVYLPSVLPRDVRAQLGLRRVSELEIECRTRLAVKCVVSLQEAIRNLDALGQYKDLNDRGQDQNTQSSRIMASYRRMRDALIEDYGRHRLALMLLEALPEGSSDLPPLTLQDTWRRSTLTTRSAGTSRRRDTALWTAGGYAALMEGKAEVGEVIGGVNGQNERAQPSTDVNAFSAAVKTQMSRRLKKRTKPNGPRTEVLESPKKVEQSHENGWIWQRNVIMGQTEDEWAKEQERVKFFRDEAEMERWREQVEIKHAEFARVIRAFRKSSEIWIVIANSRSSSTPGHVAYARKVAMRYSLMARDAQDRFTICGIPVLRDISEDRTLADQILAWRAREALRFPRVNYVRPPFIDPTSSISEHKELNPESSDDDS